MRKWIISIIVAMAIGGWYRWSRSRIDFQAFTDGQVDENWMIDLKQVSAIAFLDGGGHYADLDPGQSLSLDKTVVRPLVERLQKEAQVEVLALVDNTPDLAFVMVAKIPADRERLLLVKRIVKEADAAFPGVILRQYGYQWMHFTVLDEESSGETQAEESVEE